MRGFIDARAVADLITAAERAITVMPRNNSRAEDIFQGLQSAIRGVINHHEWQRYINDLSPQ